MSENNTALEMSPIEAISRAEVDMQIATAHRFPRAISKVKQDMMSIATLDEDTASACFYTLPRGGKTIQGPSIRLAEIAISCYGNLRAGSRVVATVADGPNPHVIVQSVCHDLEKNVAITIEKRRRITKKKSKENVDEDDINLACNACAAIALRDATFKVVPLALIKPVYEAAKRVAVGEASSLSTKRSKIIDRLKQMSATEDRILAVLGVKKVDEVTLEHLEVLIGLGTAIKDGDTTVDEAFPYIGKDQPATSDKPVQEFKKPAPAPTEAHKASPIEAAQNSEGDGDLAPQASNVVPLEVVKENPPKAAAANSSRPAEAAAPSKPEASPTSASPTEKVAAPKPTTASPATSTSSVEIPPAVMEPNWQLSVTLDDLESVHAALLNWMGNEELRPEELMAILIERKLARPGQTLRDLPLAKLSGLIKNHEKFRVDVLKARAK